MSFWYPENKLKGGYAKGRGWVVLSGHRVVSMASPGAAANNPTCCEVKPTEWAMLLEGMDGVGGAGRCVAARGGQQWRQCHLVEAHQADQDIGEDLHSSFMNFSIARCMSWAMSLKLRISFALYLMMQAPSFPFSWNLANKGAFCSLYASRTLRLRRLRSTARLK